METLIVTGAAGSIGTRVCKTLAETDGVAAILAIDTRPEMPNHRRVYHHQLDLQTDDLKPVFEGANSLIHLATSFGPSSDGMDAGGAEIDATRRVFEAASAVGIKKIVLLSSAMVYGAWPTNEIPITENADINPNPDFSFASVKTEIENIATEWKSKHPNAEVVILRPTTALAKGQISWVARSLKASAIIDAGDNDPPAQFLHLDDLASAVCLASRGELSGAYNVAPDGYIEAEVCKELSGRIPRLRLKEEMADKLGRVFLAIQNSANPSRINPLHHAPMDHLQPTTQRCRLATRLHKRRSIHRRHTSKTMVKHERQATTTSLPHRRNPRRRAHHIPHFSPHTAPKGRELKHETQEVSTPQKIHTHGNRSLPKQTEIPH